MLCPSCERDNPADHLFCSGCGSRLAIACERCGRINAVDHGFCGQCGERVATTADAAAGTVETGERRQLTLLFCDLVGSTDLSARLDPEEYGEALTSYHDSADAVISRYGGHVAQHLGDGVLAYFGWPQAYDDAAERAVRAGLDLIDAAATVQVDGVALRVRVGLHTGPVVLGELRSGERSETLALGSTPNIAARVQSSAEPGQVMISAATFRLVTGLFVVQSQGPRALKGLPQAIELYRVLQASGVRNRLAVAAARGLTPFVNRTDERRLLRGRFEQACDGEGQVVLLLGEAGIGKSRLAQMLRADLGETPHTWLETGAAPQFANTPFFAVTQLLAQLLDGSFEAMPAERAERLADVIASAGLDPADTLPLLGPLLDLPLPPGYQPVSLSPDLARRRLLASLAGWLFGSARRQPLIVVIEDLHWADPSTLELVQYLVERCATEPVLLLCTARPEFVAPWPLRGHQTTLTLNRLRGRHAREMVGNVAARSELLAEVIEQVVSRTAGVPLFLEELTRSVLETGADAAVGQIPTTLADSLMARLDRLGPQAKEVAQIGAICGRGFGYELLRAVHPIPETDLEAALQKLQHADLLYVSGLPPEATYTFKHALVQDAALDALLRSRRRSLHGRVAAALLQEFPAVAAQHPEVVAAHQGEAREVAAAISTWQRAGEQAIGRGALQEASLYLERGVGLLQALGDDATRDAAEFPLRLALGRVLSVTKGFSAPETAAAFRRARELGERLAEPEELFNILTGLFAITVGREGPAAARPLAEELFRAAERAGSALGTIWAHMALAVTHFQFGNFAVARDHGLAAHAARVQVRAMQQTTDPIMIACCYGAYGSWHRGLADEARELGGFVIERAETSSHPPDRVWGYAFVSVLQAYMLGDYFTGADLAERAIATAATEPNPVPEAVARSVRGWIYAQQGEPAIGVQHIQAAVDLLAATGQRLGLTFMLGLLVDAHAAAGQLVEERRVLDQSEGMVGEDFLRSNNMRRRAELLARDGGDRSVIEGLYRDALACAAQQGTLAFELRTAISYARWLVSHGRAPEAHAMLLPRYAVFTQGLDTRDLVDARTLLIALGHDFDTDSAPRLDAGAAGPTLH